MDPSHEDHDHDQGLQFDLRTMLTRRRAMTLLAGAGATVALIGCGSDDSTKAASSSSTGTGSSSSAASSSSSSSSASSTTRTAAASGSASGPLDAIPEETPGPYPGDGSNGPNVLSIDGVARQDITTSFGSASGTASGVPFGINLQVVDAATGSAVQGAAVYVWHCDQGGNYSLYSPAAANENYLRGVQVTDANGQVSFASIYPACYSGRWPHVHYEIYPDLASISSSRTKIATSQLALPEDTNTAVYATSGYEQSVRNASQVSLSSDMVFRDGWAQETPTITGSVGNGLAAHLVVPVNA